MKRTIPLALSLLIGASLAACAPGTLPWPPLDVSRNAATPAKAHATVTFRIVPAGGFKTKDAPGQATGRVDHFTVTLQQNGVDVAMAGNPANVAVANPANKTFNNVPAGTNYTLVADAVDVLGASVTTGAATSAAFDIVNGTIVNAGTNVAAPNPIPLALTYVAGALDPGPTVRVTGGLGGTEAAGLSLVNLLNWRSASVGVTSVASSPKDFTISDVAQGATDGNSHRLFYYFASIVAGTATVAKSQLVPGSASGKISTTQIPLTYPNPFAQNPVQAANNVGIMTIRTGGFGHTFYYDNPGPGIHNILSESGVSGVVTDLTDNTNLTPLPIADVPAFTVAPIAGHDTFFYYAHLNDGFIDTYKIYKLTYQGSPSPTAVIDLTAIAPTIPAMAADAGGAVYWLSAGNVYKLPAGISSPAVADAQQIVGTGNVDNLAVDAFGNIYYGIGNGIYKAPLGTANGTDYTNDAGVTALATDPGIAANSFSCDAAGNLYYLNGSNLKMLPAGNSGTFYTVVGTAGRVVVTPSVGADGTLFYVDNSGGVDQGWTMKL